MLNRISRVFGTEIVTFQRAFCSTAANTKPNLTEVKKKFAEIRSGKIVLSKNEETGIARITIDHADKRNSLSGGMMVDLSDIVDKLEKWKEGKGVLLHGVGGFFCSGGDLDFVKKVQTPQLGFEMAALMHDTLTRLNRLHMISASFIEGKALGGGAELTTATDYRLFSKEAQVSFVHLRMGVVPGWGGTTRLVKLVGRKEALSMLLNGTKINHTHEVLCDGTAENIDEAEQWLLKKVEKHTHRVLSVAKKTIVGAECLDYDDSLLFERSLFSTVWGGIDNKKALEANIKHK